MRAHLQALTAGDDRIEIAAALPRAGLADEMSRHHVVVVPSRFESWGYVAIEALAVNRPVLATAVGGLSEIVDESAGWLARACSAEAIAARLTELAAEPARAGELVSDGAPARRFAELTDPDPIVSAYLELAASPRRPGRQRETAPAKSSQARTVALVMPDAERGSAPETLDSLVGQTAPVDSIVVPIGVQELDDAAGAVSGGEFLVVLHAGDLLHPEFVAETVAALEAEPRAGIAFTDTALFGPGVAELKAIYGRPAPAPLALSPSEAMIVRPEPAATRLIAQLDLGVGSIPRTALIRTAAIDSAGGLPSLRNGFDQVDPARRILCRGWSAEHLPRALFGRRVDRLADDEEALAGVAMFRSGQLEALVRRVEHERSTALAERDAAREEVGDLLRRANARDSDSAALLPWRWRLRDRLKPVRRLVRR
jgi:hypothetical protein